MLRTGVVVAVRGSVAQAWSDTCSGCYRSGCSMCKREREYDFMQSLRNPGGDPDGRFAAAPHLSAGSCRFHGDEWRGAGARRCLRAQQTLQQRTHQGGTLSRSRPMRPVYDFASKRAPHQTTQRGVSHRASATALAGDKPKHPCRRNHPGGLSLRRRAPTAGPALRRRLHHHPQQVVCSRESAPGGDALGLRHAFHHIPERRPAVSAVHGALQDLENPGRRGAAGGVWRVCREVVDVSHERDFIPCTTPLRWSRRAAAIQWPGMGVQVAGASRADRGSVHCGEEGPVARAGSSISRCCWMCKAKQRMLWLPALRNSGAFVRRPRQTTVRQAGVSQPRGQAHEVIDDVIACT